jgi:hypothetical protein
MLLSIEGEALCHIVNLYRSYYAPAPRDFTASNIADLAKRVCRFSSGTFSIIDIQDGKHICTFDGAAPDELRRARVPFPLAWYVKKEQGLPFGKDVTIAKYYNTIRHGASDNVSFLPPHRHLYKSASTHYQVPCSISKTVKSHFCSRSFGLKKPVASSGERLQTEAKTMAL